MAPEPNNHNKPNKIFIPTGVTEKSVVESGNITRAAGFGARGRH